jgi:hypothetical protein
MRKQDTIAVDGGHILVLELRPQDVIDVLQLYKKADADEQNWSLETLLTPQFWQENIWPIAQNVLQPSADVQLTQLSFSEVEAVVDKFKEVNAAFFGLLASAKKLSGLARGTLGHAAALSKPTPTPAVSD